MVICGFFAIPKAFGFEAATLNSSENHSTPNSTLNDGLK
jgi:hypothetical protein